MCRQCIKAIDIYAISTTTNRLVTRYANIHLQHGHGQVRPKTWWNAIHDLHDMNIYNKLAKSTKRPPHRQNIYMHFTTYIYYTTDYYNLYMQMRFMQYYIASAPIFIPKTQNKYKNIGICSLYRHTSHPCSYRCFCHASTFPILLSVQSSSHKCGNHQSSETQDKTK